MRKALFYITLFLLLSCAGKKEPTNSVYFAGEIVNPTSDYVVLYKDEVVVDSAKIDANNRFSFTFNNIQEGLHHFKHAPQIQYVYLEKGDSLVIRLNTLAFDESLVYSGSNEEVNNFLLEMYLNYEDEEQLVTSYYELAPKDFSKKIDSLRLQKIEELDVLKSNENISVNAIEMAEASVAYNSYTYKEIYPFIHKKKMGEDIIHSLEPSFYDYRKKLNINLKQLTYFRPYYNYVNNRFGNISYMVCAQNCGIEEMMTSNDHLHFNKHKMELIDSLIKENDLRNNLFRNVAIDYLLRIHKANEECEQFITSFSDFSNNEAHIKEVNQLYTGIKSLQPRQIIPEVVVQDINGNSTNIKDISRNEQTFFYFWAGNQKRHFRNVTRHIKKLKKKHPNYKFVGINLRTSKEKWLSIIKDSPIENKNNQYRSADFDKIQKSLIIDNLNKSILTDDTLIIDAFANVFSNTTITDKQKTLTSR